MCQCLRQSSRQVYESHWSRFVQFWATKRWSVFEVRSHHFSTYLMHLFNDDSSRSTFLRDGTDLKSEVIFSMKTCFQKHFFTQQFSGFCDSSLEVCSSSGSSHQATLQRLSTETTGTETNHAQVGNMSCTLRVYFVRHSSLIRLMRFPIRMTSLT